MNSSLLSLWTLLIFPFFFLLITLRSKQTGVTPLSRIAHWIGLVLIGMACLIASTCTGLEAAWNSFWSAWYADYTARWAYHSATPFHSPANTPVYMLDMDSVRGFNRKGIIVK